MTVMDWDSILDSVSGHRGAVRPVVLRASYEEIPEPAPRKKWARKKVKITFAQIVEAKNQGLNQSEIAALYGVSRQLVSQTYKLGS